MDRLSALDAEFWYLEDGISHLHIAGVSVFEGPAPGIDEVIALLASKMHLIPRYRQRVQEVPFELGRPVWVDDPHFNLEFHVRHTSLPAPGDEAVLTRLMARLMSQPLARDRPLWESWLVEGLPDGRWAMINKVHHCMVDGIAGVGLLTALLDLDPDAVVAEPEPWEPTPAPSGAALVLDAWGGLGRDLAGQLAAVPHLVTDPAAAWRTVTGTIGGVVEFGKHLGASRPLSIEGTIGPHRRWVHASVDLADVKAVGHSIGGTVNDVVLTAISRGYRDYLIHRGDAVDHATIRTLVPVSVRHEDGSGVLDNRVSAMLLELPVHLADPLARLARVRQQMGELKRSHMAEAGEWVTAIGDLAPPMVMGAASRLAMRTMHKLPQRSVNTVTTNVPGPQFPLYCLGREMLEYRPYVPITEGIRVATAILSYNGRLEFGVTGDFDTAEDLHVLAEGIAHGVEELRALAPADA